MRSSRAAPETASPRSGVRGLLVQGQAGQNGSRFSGRRYFYRLSATTFRRTVSRSFRNVSYATLRRYPEMSAHKFARCTS